MATTTLPTLQMNDKLDYTLQPVEGKRVILTGGSSGIGRAIALVLADQGAHVLTCARSAEKLEEAAADFADARTPVHTVVAELSTEQGVTKVFKEAEKTLGGAPDILICNAALPANAVIDADYQNIEYVVKTNLLAYMTCCREGILRMKENGGGHVVLIGSMSADVREENSSIYVAAKTGIQGFAESLRKEVNKLGIKVTLIEPGSVGSDMQSDPETHAKQAEEMKMLKAEDIAACVHYCLTQPKRCDVVAVSIRPHMQPI